MSNNQPSQIRDVALLVVTAVIAVAATVFAIVAAWYMFVA